MNIFIDLFLLHENMNLLYNYVTDILGRNFIDILWHRRFNYVDFFILYRPYTYI